MDSGTGSGRGMTSRRRPLGLATGIAVASAALALLFLAMYVVTARGLPVEILVRDPAAMFEFWPFAGIVAQAGIFALCAAGVTCLFAAAHAGRDRALLRTVGAYSLVLAIDDFYMIHDERLPALGIPEVATYSVYLAAGLSVACYWRRQLFAARHAALFVAAVLLVFSVVLDVTLPYSQSQLIVEDGLKLAGMIMWSVYWITRAGEAVRFRTAAADITPSRTP
jgi:hypothetical protein